MAWFALLCGLGSVFVRKKAALLFVLFVFFVSYSIFKQKRSFYHCLFILGDGSRFPRPVLTDDVDVGVDSSSAASASYANASASASQLPLGRKVVILSEKEILENILEPEMAAIEAAKAVADPVEEVFLSQAGQAVKVRKEKLTAGNESQKATKQVNEVRKSG